MNIQCGERLVEVEVAEGAAGATLLDVIREAELPLVAPCGGKGTCAKCEVLVKDENGLRRVLACKTEAAAIQCVVLSDATATLDVELLGAAQMDAPHGIAIDLGTTTLAAELVDLLSGAIVARVGLMNPQGIFGADVISRIEACEAGHLPTMQKLIVKALRQCVDSLCVQASFPITGLASITLAGNTIMQHIATGLSPVSIGIAPYKPLSYFGEHITLWKDLPPVWFAPCISGYVGGDMVAGMLVSREAFPALLVDLGTNGELALQIGAQSVSAATAAGPVFEGMNVRFGMPALPGAVRRVFYDPDADTLCVDVIGAAPAKGICGSGLVDAVALMLFNNLIDESGRLLRAEESSSPLASRIVAFEDAPAFKLLDDAEVLVTQRDIRNLQLAKAAIAAGIEIVLDTADLELADIASLSIAGGFGQHIDQDYAAALGLIPPSLLSRAESIGNSSLDGARIALLNPEARAFMKSVARTNHYIELSTDTRFSSRFIENMGFE